MTDTRHEQPRCPICRWPYRPNGDGCEPGNCSFRPADGSPEYIATVPRFEAYKRLRAAGNDFPALDDVDAELAPKGLQCLTLTEPVWADNWYPNRHGYERTLINIRGSIPPQTRTVLVGRGQDGLWGYYAGRVGNTDVYATNHPTPEAAQAACEKAILDAWRNR